MTDPTPGGLGVFPSAGAPSLRTRETRTRHGVTLLKDDPLWYKDAVIYELHVKSFYDSDGDGIGDFPGLTSKLGYLRDLGITALWILPFYPSPLRDDGYDIADYRSVNPTYGTMEDFRTFLDEAHRRGIRVITELVINHTSDQHPWFQRARRAPRGSVEREFYVWTDNPDTYSETRIIFKDYEPSNWTWDSVAGQYFWHRFFHHQPDLNFDNPVVHEELFAVMDYWLEMGVDGMRLDAIPYLYEREGSNCENLPETHAFLKKLRAHVDENFDNRMLLAEANQWPEDAAQYFGDGDECHMNFHFPIMPRLFMSLRMEDRFPILDILEQTPQIPENAQWAVFLRNHDELTLEMVTDEERDYMYRVYAHEVTARINLGIRRRLAPLLENGRRKIELMNSLLFSLPGTPVLYYGDEIGMGDNFYLGDRHGVRTPMQWSGDRNAGFSRANPQRMYLPVIIDPEYHYESVNVEAQHSNPSSLLWWMRRLIALRRRHQAFGRGTLEWVSPENKRVLAFIRKYGNEQVLVVANLSRFAQSAEMDLSSYQGLVPVEMFGHAPFPAIGAEPYRLTLGPHNFFWFRLESPAAEAPAQAPGAAPLETVPLIQVSESWEAVLDPVVRERLEDALGRWIRARRWFGGKARKVRGAHVDDLIPVPLRDGGRAHVSVVRVDYVEEEPERYVVPLTCVPRETAEGMQPAGSVPICRVAVNEGEELLLVDAAGDPAFARALLDVIGAERRLRGEYTEIRGIREGPADAGVPEGGVDADLKVRLGAAEQTNTSIVFGDRWILKLYRRLQPGINLDRELGEHLTRQSFPHTPAIVGAIEIGALRGERITLAALQAYVPNQGDAWDFTLESLGRYLERVRAGSMDPRELPLPTDLWNAASEPLPDPVHELIEEAYIQAIRLLGRRTGELHLALAAGEAPDTRPEPFTQLYQRSLYQSMRNLLGHTLTALQQAATRLRGQDRVKAEEILASRPRLLAGFRSVLERKLEGQRIRIHGDYHLGQVLFTGKDFVIIDFEGEPARPLSERRLKRSPLRDVAGMLRSFHYASVAALFREWERGVSAEAERARLQGWARFWQRWVSVSFLSGYLDAAGDAGFLPVGDASRKMLLDVFLLEKALYELGYELANRPDWVQIPVEGILSLLSAEGAA
jgi:maltose alpha-D-glucosyltransferase/alpha-amylase